MTSSSPSFVFLVCETQDTGRVYRMRYTRAVTESPPGALFDDVGFHEYPVQGGRLDEDSTHVFVVVVVEDTMFASTEVVVDVYSSDAEAYARAESMRAAGHPAEVLELRLIRGGG